MSRRIEQLESSLQRGIATVLGRRLSDPRIEGMVSVTAVQVAPDLTEARVHVSIIPAEKEETTLQGLRHAAGRIRAQLDKELRTRNLPRLEFLLDRSLKKQAEVLDTLREVAEEEADRRGPDAAHQEDDDT